MDSKKLVGVIAVAALLLSVFNWFHPNLGQKELLQSPVGGAAGNLLAENYDPYIMYNGGYNSAKDFTVSGATSLSGTTALSGAVSLTSTFKLGSSGTAQSNQVITTCNPVANTSIAATSSGFIYCTGVTGITSSDYVYASFASSSAAIANQWVIVGAMASSTAGAVDIRIMNLTGTAAVPSAASTIASSTRIFGIH
jgi:hypothetical protein